MDNAWVPLAQDPPAERRPARDRPTSDPHTHWGAHSVLDRATWTELSLRHERRVDSLTEAYRARSAEHRSHPVEDFLFTYYTYRPSQLRRWYPGAGVGLAGAADRVAWRFHRALPAGNGAGSARETVVVADPAQYLAARGRNVRFIYELLTSIQRSAPHFGCFGLHEWAMVYRSEDRRHLQWPLRLGQEATDDVVRRHSIRCSHFDAFRFFTPAAVPLNLLAPAQATRSAMEQPGCLHTGMDLYKWAYRLAPITSSALVLDCFVLAGQIRSVDMRASPYDFSELGYRPIPVETPAGKAEYVAAQRDFSGRAQVLRARLRQEIEDAVGGPDPAAAIAAMGVD